MMDINYYKKLLPTGFAAESRVWIYQSNRVFTNAEADRIGELLDEFVRIWHSHGEPVKGYGHLFFGQFVVLMADESGAGVSGCSTDSSVRIIKEIEKQLQVRLFDRVLLAFFNKGKVQLLPLSQLQVALENNQMDANTLYFNNTVHTKAELESKWIIPIKDSWLSRKLRGQKNAGVAQLVERQLPKL
jgi:hypothetical protein